VLGVTIAPCCEASCDPAIMKWVPRTQGAAIGHPQGVPLYEYNLFEIQRTWFCSGQNLPIGKVKIEVETVYAVQRPAGPLNVTLKVNGAVAANGQVPGSAPLHLHSQRLPRGIDLGSPVALDDFDKAPFAFNGEIAEVQVKYLQ
jgi:hypothetical protein